MGSVTMIVVTRCHAAAPTSWAPHQSFPSRSRLLRYLIIIYCWLTCAIPMACRIRRCWWGYDYHSSHGTGSCQGSHGSAMGFQGRAWVRGKKTTTTTVSSTTTTSVTSVTATTVTATTVTGTTTTNTVIQALAGRMSSVETLLEKQIEVLTASLKATQDKVKALEETTFALYV